MKPLTVALTGATGFVGRHILSRFNGDGHDMRILLRNELSLDAGPKPVTVIPGSLDDETALAELVKSADLILHLAGAIKAPDRNAFMRVNRDGTRSMIDAWQRHAPDARFVLISSLAARYPHLSHYAASKAAAEDAAQGTGAVIFRPTAIYGPGDHETLRLFTATKMPVQVALNSADARLSFIHVNDVIEALVSTTRHPEEFAGKTFELSDANTAGYSWREVIAAACACRGGQARVIRLPKWILHLAGKFGDCEAASGRAPMLTTPKTREILHPDWSVPATHRPPSSLWEPKTGIKEGFADTYSWYRDALWL